MFNRPDNNNNKLHRTKILYNFYQGRDKIYRGHFPKIYDKIFYDNYYHQNQCTIKKIMLHNCIIIHILRTHINFFYVSKHSYTSFKSSDSNVTSFRTCIKDSDNPNALTDDSPWSPKALWNECSTFGLAFITGDVRQIFRRYDYESICRLFLAHPSYFRWTSSTLRQNVMTSSSEVTTSSSYTFTFVLRVLLFYALPVRLCKVFFS